MRMSCCLNTHTHTHWLTHRNQSLSFIYWSRFNLGFGGNSLSFLLSCTSPEDLRSMHWLVCFHPLFAFIHASIQWVYFLSLSLSFSLLSVADQICDWDDQDWPRLYSFYACMDQCLSILLYLYIYIYSEKKRISSHVCIVHVYKSSFSVCLGYSMMKKSNSDTYDCVSSLSPSLLFSSLLFCVFVIYLYLSQRKKTRKYLMWLNEKGIFSLSSSRHVSISRRKSPSLSQHQVLAPSSNGDSHWPTAFFMVHFVCSWVTSSIPFPEWQIKDRAGDYFVSFHQSAASDMRLVRCRFPSHESSFRPITSTVVRWNSEASISSVEDIEVCSFTTRVSESSSWII